MKPKNKKIKCCFCGKKILEIEAANVVWNGQNKQCCLQCLLKRM